jgi:hypothetical protein
MDEIKVTELDHHLGEDLLLMAAAINNRVKAIRLLNKDIRHNLMVKILRMIQINHLLNSNREVFLLIISKVNWVVKVDLLPEVNGNNKFIVLSTILIYSSAHDRIKRVAHLFQNSRRVLYEFLMLLLLLLLFKFL